MHRDQQIHNNIEGCRIISNQTLALLRSSILTTQQQLKTVVILVRVYERDETPVILPRVLQGGEILVISVEVYQKDQRTAEAKSDQKKLPNASNSPLLVFPSPIFRVGFERRIFTVFEHSFFHDWLHAGLDPQRTFVIYCNSIEIFSYLTSRPAAVSPQGDMHWENRIFGGSWKSCYNLEKDFFVGQNFPGHLQSYYQFTVSVALSSFTLESKIACRGKSEILASPKFLYLRNFNRFLSLVQ